MMLIKFSNEISFLPFNISGIFLQIEIPLQFNLPRKSVKVINSSQNKVMVIIYSNGGRMVTFRL